MSDGTGRTTWIFDAEGAEAKVTNPAGLRLTYNYDQLGQRTLLIEPGGGRFTYSWDSAGRIDHLINLQVQRTSWSHDAAARITSQRLANGIRASFSYDAADRLTRLVNITGTGTTISSFAYLYDRADNRLWVIEANGDVVTWTYDSTYQLTRELRSGINSYATTYSYDAAGNRLTMRDSGTPTTYSFDVANQVLTAKSPGAPVTYVFDANGNQTQQRGPGSTRTTWNWAYENRLSTIRLATGALNTFVYNADGQRVQKQDSNGTTKPVWHLKNTLLETDQNGGTQVI